MNNENKKNNNRKKCKNTVENANITNNPIPYETIRLMDNDINAITNSLTPIMNMANTINTIPNSLIPLLTLTNKYAKLMEDVTIAYQSINPFESFIKMVQPIDIIERYTLTQQTLEQIHNSFNLINWTILNTPLNNILQTIPTFAFDFILTDKKLHANILYHYVCEIDDEELSSIFTYDFLLKIITEDWWIIPTFDLEYYKKISANMSNNLNQSFLNEFYDNPHLIKEMVNNWNITSDMRESIINQALMNYMVGNYEICVIVLILQIEGIMKEKISHKKSFGKLRSSLEQKLINNASNNDPWNTFLNKANIDYIWNVLKPLGKNMDFKEEMGRVNRNVIAHTGVVEANQLIAMRLFFIIDTLMYIFETI